MANDFISREAAIALTDQHCFESGYDAEWMEAELKCIPAADVVEVVRCKECIHDNSNDPICPIPWVKRMLDSYCSFGERRADNG